MKRIENWSYYWFQLILAFFASESRDKNIFETGFHQKKKMYLPLLIVDFFNFFVNFWHFSIVNHKLLLLVQVKCKIMSTIRSWNFVNIM